ncbi:Bifunctional purine biosynthetic protein ade1 [Orbilia oligospora]|uniref:Bifunctional purine biosynthetic protein ade1 n=1 Tax=Orbilia oligospora TaxID=2813651 RepID=A0A7C8K498_ORBOL|nr:Bifunctional purine biosynthetic protein ade1 [Orbilia oligospora]KAF3216135.1 Bifunctional purine biosynthetic protein ade1 [Orbilia oligospora]
MIGDTPLRILLVGNGGREHALAWKLAQSDRVEKIIVAPGNGGTARTVPKTSNKKIGVTDFKALVALAIEENINLVVPGPEVPLVEGIEEHFRKVGILCFGPTKEAARMEGSKTFSKDFMQRHNIPTAEYKNFTKYEEAVEYIKSVPHNVVVKASGLAAGKGVVVATSKEEAIEAVKNIMVGKIFQDAGDEVVIEEFLEGDELSILAFSDGYTIVPLVPAQDHKRIFDGDQGPNTGGMGCYAPTKIAPQSVIEDITKRVLQPTIDGMRREGMPFVGMLFTGIMMTRTGAKVLEYNVRFGDPETQTVLPLLSRDTDLAQIMVACCEHWLDAVQITIEPRFSTTVVVVAGGYPDAYAKGDVMTLDALEPGLEGTLFHAGTKEEDDLLKTDGGRVIAINCVADDLESAVKSAYKGVHSIKFNKAYYRKDIAHRAFRQEAPELEALTYASAGVSIDAGNALVERIKASVKSTRRVGADADLGGFGGVFDLQSAGYGGPLIIGCIDGVGTKLKVAQLADKHDTVGIDLVAMNVNDLVVQGAEPLFFLDCFSCSKLDVEKAAGFIAGVADGCKQAGCALIGGETAEMPGMYQEDDYDAVGAAVGAVTKESILPRLDDMVEGDILLGLASNGVHSNGFSLVRKIVDRNGISYKAEAPWEANITVGESLLTPTRIYVKPLLKVCKKGLVKGMSHITGGGLTENIPRMLPKDMTAIVDVKQWKLSSLFNWLRYKGNLTHQEFARTWNTGIGMVLVVSESDWEAVKKELEEEGETVYKIGFLRRKTDTEEEGCLLKNLHTWD